MRRLSRIGLFVLLTVLTAGYISAQGGGALPKVQGLINKHDLKNSVEALTDPQCLGRSSGSEEIGFARRYISRYFTRFGIGMKGESYLYGFNFWEGNTRALGINVIGVIEADPSIESPKTLVLGAHYDHLGILGGRIYPGADNNASGVAAMLEVGKALAAMSAEGKRPKCNILLVAFDAKEQECRGSSSFLYDEIVPVKDISLMINLDQIGTTLAPPKEAETGGLLPKNYLLFLGMDNVDDSVKKAFVEANSNDGPIVLDFTYYGNKQVHDMLNDMGDQVPFRESGIPAIVITSGVHKYTNKTSDKTGIINFNALTERCKFIFRAVCRIAGINDC